MNFAIFSDLHGKILLSFFLAYRYQEETGEKIDLILQCGDMGIFPDPGHLDQGTKRHCKKDPLELGFIEHFTDPTKNIMDFLYEIYGKFDLFRFHNMRNNIESYMSKIDFKLICVRGNHEDHEYLDSIEDSVEAPIFPVDLYNKIHVLKTGVPYIYKSGENCLNILGIGRKARPGHDKRQKSIYIQDFEWERIENLPNINEFNIDILISHDGAEYYGKPAEQGSWQISAVIEDYKPLFHFYGHTGEEYKSREVLHEKRITRSIKMSDLKWSGREKNAPLLPNSFGILKWENRENFSFDTVKAEWLGDYKRSGWIRIMKSLEMKKQIF